MSGDESVSLPVERDGINTTLVNNIDPFNVQLLNPSPAREDSKGDDSGVWIGVDSADANGGGGKIRGCVFWF